VRIKILHKES